MITKSFIGFLLQSTFQNIKDEIYNQLYHISFFQGGKLQSVISQINLNLTSKSVFQKISMTKILFISFEVQDCHLGLTVDISSTTLYRVGVIYPTKSWSSSISKIKRNIHINVYP